MSKTYTKIDENNVAVIEVQEVRNILNKESLLKQRAEIVEKHNKDLEVLDEALAQFK